MALFVKKRLLWLYFQICTSTMRLPLPPSTWNAWTADGLSCVTLLLSSAQSLTNINGCFHSTQTGAQTCASQKSTWNLLARHPATSKVQSHTSQDFSTPRKDKQTNKLYSYYVMNGLWVCKKYFTNQSTQYKYELDQKKVQFMFKQGSHWKA